ncbi:colicin V biosynthesis protein [Aureimonas endophytica]|uniref:Colicin V biosynthesis protein n=1 Tax=Aureimonas endophytica TaxID=2027858 RepID=A0A916ZBY3_9HYPH|nr:CvpA family protein [Aureimonas endophytica]GGD85490.1 colicin V biosynthesis protein [Aureimonas endophytica]
MTVTLLDGILLGVTLISALLAMVRGFSREVLSILSWVAAAAAAFFLYGPVTPYVQKYVDNEKIAMIAAAGIVFALTLIVVSFITLRIADFIIDSRVGALDRMLGFAFGAARGILLVVVAMLLFNFLTPPESQPTWVANARSKPMLDDLGRKLEAAVPQKPMELLPAGLRQKLEHQPPAEEPGQEPNTIEGVIGNSGEAPADEPAQPRSN